MPGNIDRARRLDRRHTVRDRKRRYQIEVACTPACLFAAAFLLTRRTEVLPGIRSPNRFPGIGPPETAVCSGKRGFPNVSDIEQSAADRPKPHPPAFRISYGAGSLCVSSAG